MGDSPPMIISGRTIDENGNSVIPSRMSLKTIDRHGSVVYEYSCNDESLDNKYKGFCRITSEGLFEICTNFVPDNFRVYTYELQVEAEHYSPVSVRYKYGSHENEIIVFVE